MLPFSHAWGDVKLVWHSSLNLPVGWFVDTTPIVISDQCFTLHNVYQPCPKQVGMMNRFFILHRRSMYTLIADQKSTFSWPIDLQHSSHSLLTASSFLEWGPCTNEKVKDNGKLCFERAIVKKLAFALPFNSYCPSRLTFLFSQLIDLHSLGRLDRVA